MANISQIKLPDNTVYDIKDAGALRTITSSNVTTALGFTPLNAALKGANNGIAELDSNGKVPSSQLPSYVDDVLEYAKSSSFPATGESGKIYIAQDTNKTYRWSGTAYVEISASLALGTTSSTAYRGDYGNTAYTHAVTNKGSAFSSGLYKITTNSEGHVTAATAVAKSDITGLGIPGSDTTYTFDGTYNASTNKAATVSTVTNAIAALDGNLNNTTPGAGKTLTAFSETDGKVSATFGNISITKSQVSDLGTIGAAAAKGVDTSIAASSTSTNLPTSQAVAAFVEGKGYKTTDNDTHRAIQVNGTQALGNNTTALNLKAGSNVTITDGGSGAITIAATDTNTWRPVSDSVSSTSSSDAASSKAVKTAYDLAASKTANTGTVTSVAAGTGLSGGTITTSGTLSVSYGNTAGTACQGNDSRLSDSRNAKDVYSWAKASTKPSYTYSEVGAMPAPLFITTSNTSASDALTYGTATTLSTGQLVFVTLNKAMAGSANATLKFGSNTAINIYLTGTTQLKAKYVVGTMLGLVYNGTNLYMINPPAAV